MKRDSIRVVYVPNGFWDCEKVVTTHLPPGTSLGVVLKVFEDLGAGKGQSYNRRYRVKSISIITEDVPDNE